MVIPSGGSNIKISSNNSNGTVNSREDLDTLKIIPLGAGNEVGRSCIYLEFKNKKILVRSRNNFDDGIGIQL